MNKSNNQSVREFLINEVLRDFSSNSKDKKTRELLAELKHDKISKPVIYIGAGTCGLGAGAGKVITAVRNYLEKNSVDAEVIETGCIGLCSSEPIMDVHIPGYNRISFEQVNESSVDEILQNLFNLNIPDVPVLGQIVCEGERSWENTPMLNEHRFFKPQMRLVLENCGIIDPVNIEEYIARGGYKGLINVLTTEKPENICNKILESGLRGRGGGGFPTGTKWKFAFNEKSDQKYFICNADEGDPGAFMDRAVIEGDPHRLIEGMAISAYAIGATKAYVYIRAEYPLAIKRLQTAIKQARDYGLLGKNIYETGCNFDIKIKMGAGAFVCGEETALIHSIEGKRGTPVPRPPFPAVKGLFGKPTVINNVETIANIPGIINRGEKWFSKIGTEKSKGTKVFALSGKVALTGLVEVPMGTTIRDVIFKISGGIRNNKTFKAVQIGGPSGGCITEQNLDIKVDYESLISVGAMMGSGGLVVMDEDTCMVDIAKFFMDFIQRESCGKCIPCREGTRRMLEILESITTKPKSSDDSDALERFKGIMQLERLGKVIKETSLCGLGQTAPNPVLSTLRWFRDEYEAHIFERKCPAGACTNLRAYMIDADICTGCTACTKKCPVGAIYGSAKSPHYIIESKCIGCGVCSQTCKFNAIKMI